MNENEVSQNDYVSSLEWKLKEILSELENLQKELQRIYSEISDKQEQSKKILSLLANEKIDLETIDSRLIGDVPISDLAYDYLDSRVDMIPVHYIDLTNLLISRGKYIPGKNPSANLLTHINKDNRFVRVSSGTYALKKWNLEIKERKVSRKKNFSKRK